MGIPLQKVMALILVAVMMLGMTACGGGQKTPEEAMDRGLISRQQIEISAKRILGLLLKLE